MDETRRVDAWRYRGVRALVILHEHELRRYVETWKAAKARGATPPGADTEPAATLEDALAHVLYWARDYLVWSCENLGLPDPGVAPNPEAGDIAREVDGYVEHLLDRWRAPFREVPAEAFYEPYRTRWGRMLPVEALLEHAVVHPMRHRFQLEEPTET